mgnify:CR=1 FL=1
MGDIDIIDFLLSGLVHYAVFFCLFFIPINLAGYERKGEGGLWTWVVWFGFVMIMLRWLDQFGIPFG